jgi:IS605 OrfB family transposase
MKLIAQVKLLPTYEQAQMLKQTMEQANALCNVMSGFAWDNQVFGAFKLQKMSYKQMRDISRLTAQIVIRCYSKVADAYKRDKRTKRQFRKSGAIAYDERILRWYTNKQFVSIWSVDGRLAIPYQVGERQRELLQHQKGESDLVYSKQKKVFYLMVVCQISEPMEQETEDALGIDLGIANIAVNSDGHTHTSEVIEHNRQKIQRLRSTLQKRGSLSAKRHLRKLAGRQRRFQKATNHVISKRLVEKAQCTNRAIGLEDLTGIRQRTKAKSADQRARHSNWSFHQLRQYIAYKARMVGIPVVLVDPGHTSQQCSCCGFIDKGNRRSQSEFLCLSCGYAEHADLNAAKNIAFRAAHVIQPIVSDGAIAPAPETSPTFRCGSYGNNISI